MHEADLGRVQAFRAQVFASRQKEYNIEYRIVRSDGEVRWIERRSSVSYSRGGRPERVIGVIIDITERKRVEQLQRALTLNSTIALRMCLPRSAQLSLRHKKPVPREPIS